MNEPLITEGVDRPHYLGGWSLIEQRYPDGRVRWFIGLHADSREATKEQRDNALRILGLLNSQSAGTPGWYSEDDVRRLLELSPKFEKFPAWFASQLNMAFSKGKQIGGGEVRESLGRALALPTEPELVRAVDAIAYPGTEDRQV